MNDAPPTVHLRAIALRWTPPPQAGEEIGARRYSFLPRVYGGGVEPGFLPGETVGGRS
jgi:hypothetical protein